eukprot:1157066-Pelagomonas_calceolata.AAC.4
MAASISIAVALIGLLCAAATQGPCCAAYNVDGHTVLPRKLLQVPAPINGPGTAPVNGHVSAPGNGHVPAPGNGHVPAPVNGAPAPVNGAPAPVNGRGNGTVNGDGTGPRTQTGGVESGKVKLGRPSGKFEHLNASGCDSQLFSLSHVQMEAITSELQQRSDIPAFLADEETIGIKCLYAFVPAEYTLCCNWHSRSYKYHCVLLSPRTAASNVCLSALWMRPSLAC